MRRSERQYHRGLLQMIPRMTDLKAGNRVFSTNIPSVGTKPQYTSSCQCYRINHPYIDRVWVQSGKSAKIQISLHAA